ncbi:uncharacterized protein KIAA1671 homolog isoform X1 [Phalacrocorax aristotelis]|uniref:uncharacterized protein KIAA1671 homolog isoform X1 n=1 Tax=Phalacrocorax aristotelis TaxID=126867 RepID=UPI003F4C2DD0
MATRVEINSTLASLTTVPDLNEIRNEDKSQRVYVSVLPDASNKAKEASASLTLDEKDKFGSTLRSATMPSLGSRPRLFPKPFSKDKSSDTFANVKPPIPAFRSSSLIRKATEEASSVKILSGNVPPLVDQKVIENENKVGSEVVTNMTFYAGPSANTVILFETAGTEQSKVSMAQENRAADDRRVFSTTQTKELQCNMKLEEPSQPSETSRNPEGSLHRQILLSSSLGPVSWNSLKSGEKKDAHEVHPVEKNDDANSINSKVDFSIDVQQRPKHRPVSAIFLESLRDQKHRTGEASEEKSPTEKSWIRKPRPLSMDLTAKFEHKDLSCKKTCSSQESKENVPIISFTDVDCHDQSEMGPKSEEPEFNKGNSSKTNLKYSTQDIGILNNGKYIWETKLKSKSEQIEAKPEILTNLHGSERSHETTSESRINQGGKRPDQKETYMFLGCESPAASSEKENNITRGSVKKHISLFTSENASTSMDTEMLQSAAEREDRCVNIQQRIKELTTENSDVKPGNLRRSLQSRPLSADLTKMFSSPTSSSEAKPEKPAETRNDSINEMQENQTSKEIKVAHGTDFSEGHATGNPWKPRQILKITNKPDQIERKGSFLGDGQHFSQQSENPVSFTSNLEKKLKPTTLMEKTYVKTVRATMFDHNVQRRNIAADHPGTDSTLKMNNELEAKHDVVTLGHSRRSWMGEVEETTSIKEYHKQSDSSKHIADVEKSGKPAYSSEDKKMTPGFVLEKSLVEKSEKPTPKNAEDSLIYQRIEPRYEIFQTCGERALSEAITMAPEKKAMTLRTRKSSVKENKNNEDVLHTGQSARANGKTLYLKEDNVITEARDTKVFTSKSVLRDPNDFFSSECTLPEQKKDSDKTETDLILIAEKTPYSTNKSRCLGINEKVNQLHSEIKNKSEVSSMDKTERSDMMRCLSDKRSFRPGGTDSYEFRTNFDHDVTSTSVNKHGAQSSSVLSSGQFCKSSSSYHPDTKVLTINKEESRAFGLRKSLDLNCKEQDFNLDSTARENSEKIRVIDPEEKVRRSKSSVSDLKISERWRRRTLPQDSLKTEEVVWLTPENIKRLSRTDSLQLDEGSVKKRSKKSKEGVEGNEANQTVLGSPDIYLKNQSSAFEPKATYFAVTYQIPGNKKKKSFVGSPSASETNTISSSSEGATINLDPVFPGRSKPLLQQPNKNLMSTNCREDSWEVHINKDWVKEEGKDDIFSKNIASGNFHVSRKDNQQYHGRVSDHSKEKIIDVDAFLLKQDLENTAQTDITSSRRTFSYHEPRSPLHFGQFHKDSELVPQKRSENNCDLSGRKAEDGYRSQILDIDALMAEYKDESVKASNVRDKLSEDYSSFSREKSKNKRNASDRMTSSYSWKERKGSDRYSVNNKQGDCAEEYQRSEKLILNEKSKEKLESRSPEFDKQKSKDRKISPPYWGNPSSFFSDKFVNSPVDFTRKKTFIVDEDEEVNLTSRNQSSKSVIDKVQPLNVIGTVEVNFASKLSIKADDGLLQKKLVTKEQFLEVSPEGDWSKNVARSSLTRNKDNANKTTRENDSSNVKSKTDWKSYTSGLGSAPPDLRRSYSEKIRQGRDNLPLMQEDKGRKDLYRSRQSFPLETADSGWKHKLSSQSVSFFHEDKKVSRKEWTKQSSDKPDLTEFSLVSTRRSHHSFHKDRRADNGTDQLKQCFSRQPPGVKDTDTLVQEPDSQYGTWNEQRHSGDSFVPESPSLENDVISTRKQPPNSHPSSLSSQTEPASLVDHHDFSKDQRSTSLDHSSTDMDSTDGTDLPPPGDTYPDEKTTDFSFIDQTTILDSSALKTRAQLSKKRRHRAPISHSLRRSRGLEFENRFSSMEEPDNTWMFKDSTEEKKTMQQEDSDEEDKTQHTVRSSSVQAQRLPVFPGMDHSVLKAQLRKRQESESLGEISSAQLFKSPKPQLQLGTPGSRVLPSSVEKEDRLEEKSPQWLKELKSRKRQSHYENQV